MTTEVISQSGGYFALNGNKTVSNARKEYAAQAEKTGEEFGSKLRKASGKKCPYSHMAKDGIIEYNGVTFYCDYDKNAITLGDMSNSRKVLKINLPSGGGLHVNVDNLDEISKAAGMFTPEDLEAIMRAIHEYNQCTRKLYEIDKAESESVEEAANEDSNEAVKESSNEIVKEPSYENKMSKSYYELQPKPIGLGTAIAGQTGYGMSAYLINYGDVEDTVIRVSLGTDYGQNEHIDVKLSEFDPKNATAVEMFAYCQYKDYIGEGSDNKWGSWNAIKNIISPAGMDFGSFDNIKNEKRNWTELIAGSKTVIGDPNKGETMSALDLLKLFEEQNRLSSEELKENGEDWRSMSSDDWERLLDAIDKNIDTYKEEMRERIKKQLEAAQKAAMEADFGMKATAAHEAALSVAASGFYAGTGKGDTAEEDIVEDSGVDHEKNWTRKLKTNDQTVLRTARYAQIYESMAISHMEELASGGVSSYASYDVASERYVRDKRYSNYA